MSKWHKNPLPGPLGVCLGWALKHFRVETFLGVKRQLLCQFGRLTLAFVPVLELNARILELTWNACLGHQILGKVWTIIYCWKAQDVYFPTPLRARQLGFCSSRKSTSSAGRSESNSICSPFQPLNQIFAQVPQFQPENTWNYRKTHKLIVKSRKVNFN